MQKSTDLCSTVRAVVLLYVPEVFSTWASGPTCAAISTTSAAADAAISATTAIPTAATVPAGPAIPTIPTRRVSRRFRGYLVPELLPHKKKGVDCLEQVLARGPK